MKFYISAHTVGLGGLNCSSTRLILTLMSKPTYNLIQREIKVTVFIKSAALV